MLSAAKHLAAECERPYAALKVTTWGGSKGDNQEKQHVRAVMLSAAKHLAAECERPFAAAQGDNKYTSIWERYSQEYPQYNQLGLLQKGRDMKV